MTKEELRDYLRSAGVDEKGLKIAVGFPYLDQYENVEDFEDSFAGAYLLKNPKRPKVAVMVHEALHTKRVEWKDLNSVNLTKIRRYIANQVSPNSARTYFATISAVLRPYANDNIISCDDPSKVLSQKKVPAEKIALTAEELENMWQFHHQLYAYPKHYFDIWHDFMMCSYIGCRHSDLAVINTKCIKEVRDIEGNVIKILEYISVKTSTKCYPPLHPNVVTLMGMPTSGREYCPAVIAHALKDIAEKCGITQELTLYTAGKRVTKKKSEFMGTHTARHTFATLLAGGKHPVPIPEIAKYMGHASIEQTMRYIVKSEMPMTANAVMNFY